jgi:tRNA pseudouridine55 synthase
VRSLIAELGDAYCEALRRTRIGRFDVDAADPERIVALDAAVGFLPEVRLSGDTARAASHGRAVAVGGPAAGESAGAPLAGVVPPGAPSLDSAGARSPGVVRLIDDDGLIALAEPTGDGWLKPVVGLRG